MLKKDSKASFSIETEVEFSDTDAAGLLHFSTYFRYMELAESKLLQSIGIPLLHKSEGEFFGFPRIDVNCRFSQPVFFQDKLKIELFIEELNPHSITYRYLFYRWEEKSWTKTAKGKMRVAFVQKNTQDNSLNRSEMPSDWISKLKPFLA